MSPLSDALESPQTLLAKCLRLDEPVSRLLPPSHLCFSVAFPIKVASSPTQTHFYRWHLSLLDGAAACHWRWRRRGPSPASSPTPPWPTPPHPLSLPLKPQGLNGLSLRGKQTRENCSTSSLFFFYIFFLISASLGVFRGQRVNRKPPIPTSAGCCCWPNFKITFVVSRIDLQLI